MDDIQLINLAFQAAANAYAPYSEFHVGAVVLLKDGHYFMGANIENCSYGGTNCAERSALFAAYSYGYRKDDIVKMACVSDGKKISYSCGICRQVMSELMNPDTPVIFASRNEYVVRTVAQLLPDSFSAGDIR